MCKGQFTKLRADSIFAVDTPRAQMRVFTLFDSAIYILDGRTDEHTDRQTKKLK